MACCNGIRRSAFQRSAFIFVLGNTIIGDTNRPEALMVTSVIKASLFAEERLETCFFPFRLTTLKHFV
jgi:hypothetical protein